MMSRLMRAVLAIAIFVPLALLLMYMFALFTYSPWKFYYYGFWGVRPEKAVERCLRSDDVDYIFAAIDSVTCAEAHLDSPLLLNKQARVRQLALILTDPMARERWRKQSIPERRKYNGISSIVRSHKPANVYELVEIEVLRSIEDIAITGTVEDMQVSMSVLGCLRGHASASALPCLERSLEVLWHAIVERKRDEE